MLVSGIFRQKDTAPYFIYAEGVTSQSPALRSYPGLDTTHGFYAEGVISQSPGLRSYPA